MTSTDARIAVTIEHGFAEQLYFVSVRFPRLADHQVAGVFPARELWMPVTSEIQTDLLPLVGRLRPMVAAPSATVARATCAPCDVGGGRRPDTPSPSPRR